MGTVRLELGDCLEVLKTLKEASVAAVVTDPPYELGFMGKSWDSTGVANNVEMWRDVLRVLKPGGHLLSFGGSRTYHRMACAIEDAGFEIRDQIMWVYGSGFPKSLNIGKAVDKINGREVKSSYIPNYKNNDYGSGFGGGITDNTPADNEWNGWGTALKPAHEPIVLARKPLSEKTVAENVLKWGTGGLNIDGCRVGDEKVKSHLTRMLSFDGNNHRPWHDKHENTSETNTGRFPANFIHDGSDGVVRFFPNSKASKNKEQKGTGGIWSKSSGLPVGPEYGDSGSSARFFYCAKASKSERNKGCEELEEKPTPKMDGGEFINPMTGVSSKKTMRQNHHPTVKPVALMRYLCKLVTPPGGIVLDPFLGSGTTGVAAIQEGFGFVGIEREQEYIEIARARIHAVS